MFTAVTIIILIICGMLALVVLAQNPKGGGLAAGFTGAQQIGGVQRTADFLEKATWTLSSLLMVLCLVSAGMQQGPSTPVDPLDSGIETGTESGAEGVTDEAGQPAPEGQDAENQ